jgi:hypothetical protein
MPDRGACRSARAVIQRAVTGAPVSDTELEAALAHVAGCTLCEGRFDLAPLGSLSERTDDISEVAEPAEPIAVFERALTAALSDSEAIVRIRAAERLGAYRRLGPIALDSLAAVAGEDPDEEAREAALAALDRLDTEVSLSQRLIEQWSATPAEAAPYLEDVLARLAAPEGHPPGPVTQLVASASDAQEELVVNGKEGITGRLVKEKDELWLRLHALPSIYERAKPVVAVPNALERDAPSIRWHGESPGLVSAQTPVTRGTLDVVLGDTLEPQALSERLFGHVYLLTPREQSEGI